MDLQALGWIAGGLGLFLLGMDLMTDGLKLAAGPALHRLLTGAARTPAHALGAGLLVTAVVQASHAATVAAIGFVNAGLLALGPALWVLLGATVGTTVTGWTVALVGLKFKVELAAMPLVCVGALMRMTGRGQPRGAVGTALAGFGLLFMGIALLHQSFDGLTGQVRLMQGQGWATVVAQLGMGGLMTVLMHSSSAAMAVTLAAAQGGVIDLPGAAAVVVGATLGTTVTALQAARGATSNAQRAAAGHVAFNLAIAAVGLLLLPGLAAALQAAGLAQDPAIALAAFYTVITLLGALLWWPLAGRLTRGLQARFGAREQDEAQPQFLDDNVLAVPTLALDALAREVARATAVALRLSRAALAGAAPRQVAADGAVAAALDLAIERFVSQLRRAPMSVEGSARLAGLLRVQRYAQRCAEQAAAAVRVPPPRLAAAEVVGVQAMFTASAGLLLEACEPAQPASADPALDRSLEAMEHHYEDLRAALLTAGVTGRLDLPEMEQALQRASLLRRSLQQAGKARRRLATVGAGP